MIKQFKRMQKSRRKDIKSFVGIFLMNFNRKPCYFSFSTVSPPGSPG